MTVLVVIAATVIPVLAQWVGRPPEGEYTFLYEDALGRPFRWNPCESIHYVVNLGTAPNGSLEDVQEAISRVSAATGIPFAYDGLTDEVPTRERDPYQPETYGRRWAPVLVAWVSPLQTDIAFIKDGHTAAGVASAALPEGVRGTTYVSGWVAINAEDPNGPGFDRYGEQGPVVQHELSHIVGLGHVKQWGELMQNAGGGVTDFAPGDLEGLQKLGIAAGCTQTPPVPAG